MDYAQAADKVDRCLALGCTFARVEMVVKAIPGITEDQRASLWLYAFLCRQPDPSAVPPRLRPLVGVR